MFFCGQYHHQLDDKGRLRIPPAFRKQLGDNPVIFRDEKCLQIYTAQDFEKLVKSRFDNADIFDEKMNKRKRKIFPSVQTVAEDKQGRVSVNPSFLKDCMMVKDIISIGVLDHVEIWDEKLYDAYINDRELENDDKGELDKPDGADEQSDSDGEKESGR